MHPARKAADRLPAWVRGGGIRLAWRDTSFSGRGSTCAAARLGQFGSFCLRLEEAWSRKIRQESLPASGVLSLQAGSTYSPSVFELLLEAVGDGCQQGDGQSLSARLQIKHAS